MQRPPYGYTERAQAVPLLMLAQKAGLGSEALGIFTACIPLNGPSDEEHTRVLDWCRAHDELQELLHERGISNIDHLRIELSVTY